MSLYPKNVIKSKHSKVTIHMEIRNYLSHKINGIVQIKIINPYHKKRIIKEKIVVQPLSKINKFYFYKISKNSPIGKYMVDGRFFSKGKQYKSKTYKTDFFKVQKLK